ncbi:hypothetical protein [uncultured Flavobacterium sp.]|uniref:hypothetical protein n=1 Tax=uncultured Flavobacterium sp. TaxID=165435 RepID=UPI0025CC5102|nr:hypothetical protein [uncultured Flavobacterium sp.]
MLLRKEKEAKLIEVQKLEDKNFKLQSYYYAIFSANIHKFLPEIEKSKYKKMFYDSIYSQHCAVIEQSSKEYLMSSKIINHSNVDIEKGEVLNKTIFATFHLGSYKTIISFLYNAGFKIALIIDDTVFKSQSDVFEEIVKNIIVGKKTSELVILNVKERSSIVRLKKMIEDGYVMAVYLDGNTGINVESQDFSKSYMPISFLNQNLNVKYGVGKLAALLNATVVPLISYRGIDDANTIEIYKEILIDDFDDKEVFAKKAIEYCYSILEKKVRIYPTQWECWGYIHKWFSRDLKIEYNSPVEKITKFNDCRYEFFEANGTNFLFDLFSYTSFPITEEICRKIKSNDFLSLKPELLLELNNKNILI